MWIYNSEGFFSVVQNHECSENELMVRARCKQDLENLLRLLPSSEPLEIIETMSADYAYRVKVCKRDFADYLFATAMGVKYPNFKNSLPKNDDLRRMTYEDVWSAMYQWQARLKRLAFQNKTTRRRNDETNSSTEQGRRG